MIYFDHNATTPLDNRVLAAMLPYLQTIHGNPASLYRLGRIARSAIDLAREQLAELLGCSPEQIVFTSGGTEANHLALHNAGAGNLFISATEHPSVLANAQAKPKQLKLLEVDSNGLINTDKLCQQPINAGDFFSIMLANNETGTIQNIASLSEQLYDLQIVFHTDAVQAVGKMPVSFNQLGVQLMSVSSHKIYGPKGCGALIFAKDFPLQAYLHGGEQEQAYRAGTENVAAIVGFGKAAELARLELSQRIERLQSLKNRLEQQLLTIPGMVIFAKNAHRLCNTVQFSIQGVQGDMLLMQLDRHNIAVSSGSACKASSGDISTVLTAMDIDSNLAKGAIRVSLGKDNTEPEIDWFVQVLKSLILNS